MSLPTPSRDGAAALSVFSFLWAASVLFHAGSYDRWDEYRLEAIAALWVLFRPASTWALAVLMALQAAAIFPIGPRVPNHAVFAAMLGAGFLLSAVALLISRRRRVERDELYHVFAPAARWSLIILYFFASFHKLNEDWFDPGLSCATTFLHRQTNGLLAPDWLGTANMYLALGCEMVIPLLLAFRRTRHAGVLVGMVFHWVLATNPVSGFYNFSSMLFAVFSLFVSEDLFGRVRRIVGDRRLRYTALVLAAIAAGYVVFCQPFAWAWLPPSRQVARGAWSVWGTSLIGIWVVLLFRQPLASQQPSAFRLPMRALAVIPVLVFLNGAAPYLGLHTTATWAMYSNLRTEGGRSNHLLVPARMQMFGFQRDAVRIVRSSDPQLHAWRGQFLPYFEVTRRPEASITYERRGVRHSFRRVADDPAYRKPHPVLGALLAFRPYERGERQPCVH
jgi:hypothetical protein